MWLKNTYLEFGKVSYPFCHHKLAKVLREHTDILKFY